MPEIASLELGLGIHVGTKLLAGQFAWVREMTHSIWFCEGAAVFNFFFFSIFGKVLDFFKKIYMGTNFLCEERAPLNFGIHHVVLFFVLVFQATL